MIITSFRKTCGAGGRRGDPANSFGNMATGAVALQRFLVAFISIFLVAASAFAQVGNDNPTGTSGQFNGNVTTGCSYDPYTANATRSITDLVVAGGVGSYPLAFTRTMNSRYSAGVGVGNAPAFGAAGTWTHSYQWTIDSTSNLNSNGRPIAYWVNYPDGRRIFFQNTGTSGSDFTAPKGVRDRFEHLSDASPYDCYLRLPDGGRIWFKATKYGGKYSFSFYGIIDPYNQTTLISYPTDGSLTVTEPAGRTIKIFYRQISSTSEGKASDVVVDHVTGSDGRTVQYNYTAYVTASGARYTSLSSVVYFSDASLTATYTYQPGNAPDPNGIANPNGRPLIRTCTDPMFDGPMWKIAYDFATGTNGNGTAVVYGQLRREKHPNGTAVSTLTVNANPSSGWYSRTETRGDGPSRTFTYNGYRLKTVTDFKGVAASQGYDSNYYLAFATDRNGNTTTYVSNVLNGNIKSITSATPSDAPGATVTQYKYGGAADCNDSNNTDANNPYYLCTVTNGPTYMRFPNMQIQRIDYPATSAGPSYENFTYNGYGQVLTHRMRNGYTESWTYSGSRVTAYYDGAHPTSGHPTAWYSYNAFGRVWKITDGRGSQSGDVNYTTTFNYNARGQLTKLAHPDGTYIQYGYNPNGTLAWTADERHPGGATDDTQRTSYTYDDYKRLRTVTTPVRAAGDTTARITTYFYDQSETGEDYTRTANAALTVTAVGDSHVPSATTQYVYDSNGNTLTVTDPNIHVTSYRYDELDRVKFIDDPISLDRNSDGHTVSFGYDVSGNLVSQKRADDKSCAFSYDSMGFMTSRTGYAGEYTDYQPDLAGNLIRYRFQKGDGTFINYFYEYDGLNRQKKVTYPADASGATRSETYDYDVANHLQYYHNPAGQVKTLGYDTRGRLHTTTWSANGPNLTINYDTASRPTSISTTAYSVGGVSLPATTIGFGYDEANNRTYEDQTVSGITRRVQTDSDADGNRTDLLVKTGTTPNFANYFDYTSRNELLTIKDSSQSPFFQYSYDAAGNVTQRLNQRLSGDSTVTSYDAMNRPQVCRQNRPGAANFAVSHYDYNKRGDLKDTYRDEEGGKGDYFSYDDIDQVATALYSATGPSDSNPAKRVTYNLSVRNRTSMTVDDNILNTTTTTTYTPVDLNQYAQITVNNTARTVSWSTNFNLSAYNGWGYVYDAENRLTSVSGPGHSATFTYDAVGRCVKRVIDNVTRILTYDQWTPVAEWDGSGNLIATNVFGLGDDEILYRVAGSTQLYYKSDPMGNVKFMLDQYGNGIEKYTYDGFGQPKITDWSGNVGTASAYGNRFMFSGREYFSELGLYDMRNRVYDPNMGRFYQTDPIGFEGDPLNLYRFCGNNPLLGGDQSGLDGLDTGSPLSADQIPGSGNFSDLSSPGQDWLYNGGMQGDFALSSALDLGGSIQMSLWDDSFVNSLYPAAGSDNPVAYTLTDSFTAPASSSVEASSPIMFDTSSVNSGSTGAQDQVASFQGGPIAQAEGANCPKPIGFVNDLLDIGNHAYTGNAQKLQNAGKFAYAGKAYKMRFTGGRGPGYRAIDVGAAKIGQARLATAGGVIGRLGTYGGLGLAAYEVFESGASTRSLVKAGVSLGAPFLARIPPPYVGVPLALGAVVADFKGYFDGFYNKFDNTPRFGPKPPPQPQPPVVPMPR